MIPVWPEHKWDGRGYMDSWTLDAETWCSRIGVSFLRAFPFRRIQPWRRDLQSYDWWPDKQQCLRSDEIMVGSQLGYEELR